MPGFAAYSVVMPGLDPGIHLSTVHLAMWMDCRVKPGNDF
ncbi:MAG: hypothetical protein OJF62_002264 [Pseudolabrys sp.]|jgi:hypothetical protein|nr:hypothetical protein [Pseudolabrys sp.]